MSTTTLEHSLQHVTIPPRSVWSEGYYLTASPVADGKTEYEADRDFRTWVVPGEGTPGNFKERRYVLPEEIATSPDPKHPADWPKDIFKTSPYTGGWRGSKDGTVTQTKTKTQAKKTPVKSAPPLPVGIRFRCPYCGHWYKEMDLAGHSKVCPGTQEGEGDWAIACECCESLDDTAKCKKGFPRPKPKAAAAPPETKDGDPKYKPEPETLPATFDKETKPGEPLKETPKKKEAKPDGDGTPAT
jgi:hypothetical protein